MSSSQPDPSLTPSLKPSEPVISDNPPSPSSSQPDNPPSSPPPPPSSDTEPPPPPASESSEPPSGPSQPPTGPSQPPGGPSGPGPSGPGQPPPTPPPGGASNSGPVIPLPSVGPSDSVVPSVIVITQSGSTYTTFTYIPNPSGGSHTVGGNGNSSSKTGSIVGGVVGGIVGLAALVLLAWFLTRRARQKRLERQFDGDFSPNRIGRESTAFQRGGTLPDLGLDEDDARITPFPVPSSPSMSQPHHTSPSISTAYNATNPDYQINPQHHVNDPHPYVGGYPMPMTAPRPSSSVGEQSQSVYSQSTHPSMYPVQQHNGQYPPVAMAAYPQSHTSGSSSGGAIPSRKAQEAGFGRMNVVNPQDVVVHSDGGRVPQEHGEQQQELPPTYDSIPREQEAGGAGASGSRQ